MTVNSTNSTGTNGVPASSATAKTDVDPLANKETFLRLLVAQIQNQNPLNPSDPIQFLSQLTEFSNLEQTLQMRQNLDAIKQNTDLLAAAQKKTQETQG